MKGSREILCQAAGVSSARVAHTDERSHNNPFIRAVLGTTMPDYEKLSREELIRLLSERDGEDLGGIRLTYPGHW
jgi:hypothetical protein